MLITCRSTPAFLTAGLAVVFSVNNAIRKSVFLLVSYSPRDKWRLHPSRRRHTSVVTLGPKTRLHRTPRGSIFERSAAGRGATAARRRRAPGRRASANQRAHRLTTVQLEGAELGARSR